MNHEDALNEILAHTCPDEENNDVLVFVLDLHCVNATVKARLVDNVQNKFEIISVQFS